MRAIFMTIAAMILAGCGAPEVQAPAAPPAPKGPAAALPQAAARAADATGQYQRIAPARATLTIRAEGSGWRAAIRAGGLPAGAGTAADCVIHVVGPMTDGRIVGRPVPFAEDAAGMDAAEIGDNPPEVAVALTPTGATVSDGGAAARYCAMGSDIGGNYVRR